MQKKKNKEGIKGEMTWLKRKRKKNKKIFGWEIQTELSYKNIKIVRINMLKKSNDKMMNFSTYRML